MDIVLDASVALAWYFEDETSSLAQSLLERIDTVNFIVPTLWFLEVSNRLQVALRRNRITEQQYYAATRHVATLDCDIETGRWPQDINLINQIAIKYKLAAYDAWYVHIAKMRNIALATLDNDMHLAAKKAGIKLYAP